MPVRVIVIGGDEGYPSNMRSTSVVGEALDRLDQDDPAGLSDAELGAELVGLRRLLDAAEARWLRMLAAFDRRGAGAGAGAVTTGAWLRSACRMSPGAAAERVAVARRLEGMPVLAGALGAGEVSYPHARLIARAVEELAAVAGAGPAAAVEAPLVAAARVVDPCRLRREIEHARHAISPDSAVSEAERAHARRRLSVSETVDGVVVLDGVLDPEGGAVLLSALAPLAVPAGPDDGRTARQRRADGLVELCRRHLDRGDLPETGGERPHLTVLVDVETLERHRPARAAELAWAGPVCGETARRLACDASITRVITAGRSEPLDVGRRTRVVPPAIRTALAVRDGGCTFPGCDRPPVWTDAHHLQHWADGGPTSLNNLILLCRRHHRAVHEGAWRPRPRGRLPAPPRAA